MTTPLKIQASPPLRGGLDAVASPLPMSEDEWRVGIEVTPPARNSVHLWDATGCADVGYELDAAAGAGAPAELTEKTENGVASGFKFYPTGIVAQVECHVSGTQSAIGDIILENAQADLDRMQWRALEAVLHGAAPVMGPAGERNPSLANYDDDGVGQSAPTLPDGFDPTAPGDLKGSLQGLLDGICACSKGDLTLHVPVSFLPYFLVDGAVRWNEDTGRYTYGSHTVSFGCYPNRGPQDTEAASPTADDGTEVWIYSTGPVYYAFGDTDTVQEVVRRQNKAIALVERPAIVAFDPVCVYAVKAKVA